MQPAAASSWIESTLSSQQRDCSSAEVHLWSLALDAPPHPLTQLDRTLGADERLRASRFMFEADGRRYRTAHGLLRLVLAHYLKRPPATLTFDVGPTGKPRLGPIDAASGLQFNLSHSGSHALLGVARHMTLGVDIEQVRPLAEFAGLAKANFAPRENQELNALPSEQRVDGFFACWTRKEAVIKALGGGLSIALDSFDVSVDPGAAAHLRALPGNASAGDWTLWSGRPVPGYWAAAAVDVQPVEIHTFSLC